MIGQSSTEDRFDGEPSRCSKSRVQLPVLRRARVPHARFARNYQRSRSTGRRLTGTRRLERPLATPRATGSVLFLAPTRRDRVVRWAGELILDNRIAGRQNHAVIAVSPRLRGHRVSRRKANGSSQDLSEDVIPFIQSTYRRLPIASGVAIVGFRWEAVSSLSIAQRVELQLRRRIRRHRKTRQTIRKSTAKAAGNPAGNSR